MAVHVDDIVIAGSDEACRDFRAALNTKFPTNNLGELTWYTGCAFKRNWELGTLEITQKAFVESMLNRFGVNSSSDIFATPGVELGPREEGEPKGDWPHREAVNSLMWLSTMTRPTSRTRCVLWRAILTTPPTGTGKQFRRSWHTSTGQGVWV